MRRMMRGLFAAVLACGLVLTGCGQNAGTAAQTTAAEKAAEATEVKTTEAPAATTPAATETPAETTGATTEAETEPTTTEAETEATTAEPKVMYTKENLTMRAAASKDAEKLGVVPINTAVSVLDDTESYFQVEYDGKTGFILGSYLTEDQEEAKQAAADKKKAEASENKNSGGGQNSDDEEEEHQGMADQCNTDGLVGD